MNPRVRSSRRHELSVARHVAVSLLFACILVLGGCGGTKVYTADKTIVYNGNLYNLANVQRIGSRVEGRLADGTTVNMKSMDKKAVEGLLKENGETMVSTFVEMDDKEMLYQRSRVKRYSDYSKMVKRLEGAQKDIAKFMADKKKTQLKLK